MTFSLENARRWLFVYVKKYVTAPELIKGFIKYFNLDVNLWKMNETYFRLYEYADKFITKYTIIYLNKKIPLTIKLNDWKKYIFNTPDVEYFLNQLRDLENLSIRKNPVTFNYENLRRWLIVNIPNLYKEYKEYSPLMHLINAEVNKYFNLNTIQFRPLQARIPSLNNKTAIILIITVYINQYFWYITQNNKFQLQQKWRDFNPSLIEICARTENGVPIITWWLRADPAYFGITYSGPIRYEDQRRIQNLVRKLQHRED